MTPDTYPSERNSSNFFSLAAWTLPRVQAIQRLAMFATLIACRLLRRMTLMAASEILGALRELAGQVFRSSKARRAHPHVFFGPNASIGVNCQFGKHVRIYGNTKLSQVEIGDFTYVGSGSQLHQVSIGKFCSVGPNVRLGLGKHPIDHVSTYPGFYSTAASGSFPFVNETIIEEYEPIAIGNDVWIGAGAFVMDGVHVGDGAIIGAGAIVTRDVLPYSIVAGVPAREVRKRFSDEIIEFLRESAWWDRDEAFLRRHAQSFRSPDALKEVMRKEAMKK